MSIHQKFADLLTRLAITPQIARARRDDVARLAAQGEMRVIELGVARTVERLEARVAELEKSLA